MPLVPKEVPYHAQYFIKSYQEEIPAKGYYGRFPGILKEPIVELFE